MKEKLKSMSIRAWITILSVLLFLAASVLIHFYPDVVTFRILLVVATIGTAFCVVPMIVTDDNNHLLNGADEDYCFDDSEDDSEDDSDDSEDD